MIHEFCTWCFIHLAIDMISPNIAMHDVHELIRRGGLKIQINSYSMESQTLDRNACMIVQVAIRGVEGGTASSINDRFESLTVGLTFFQKCL